ncbi:GIN domain-containing protein [Flavobacterium qiangtangense]|uniref:GIN domain-containing protein n=1 Tax=Flavobacterium qiangtangense TaxID=1442595 RepID=A0ABW1PRC7_9FLAO
MKRTILFALLLISSISFAQSKEKIKGTKTVTIAPREIKSFENLEVSDNIEVFLVKGDNNALEIEADENLHEIIESSINAGTLHLSTTKNATTYKKLSVKITYTSDLKLVTAKNDVTINALSDIDLDNITFKTYDYTKLFLNVKSRVFSIFANDKSKVELNVKSESAAVELSKSASMKALISSETMKFDMYQKSTAVIEGDIVDLKLRLDNNSNFTGKNLSAKTAEIITEAYATGSILVTEKATLDVSAKSELQLFGDQKIEIKRFTDSAVIMKKPTK